MNAARGNVEQALSSPPAARFAPVISGPNSWYKVHELLQAIEDHLGLLAEKNPDSEARLRLLIEQMAAVLKVLRQAHEHLDGRMTEQTAELSQSVAGSKKQLTERAHAERRLAAEHAVARILAQSTRLTDAAPKILQVISQSLKWDAGGLWILDRDAGVLRCLEVWHPVPVALAAFEQASRQSTFGAGVGLPGRVWASDSPCWVPDLAQDANFPRATAAARDGLHAAVGFPLRNGSEFLGVMEFFSREIRQPDEELLQMMTSIGSHISQFMERMKAENALLSKETELGIARRIQQGLVAKTPPVLAGFEIAGASHSAVETGGDYFDFIPLLDSCQGIVIADASGHGLGSALLATATRAYLRAFALTDEDISRILALVNCRLVEDVGEDRFVTLLLARLDPRTRSLFYTSAGHVTGFLIDSLGRLKTPLESTGLPLGIESVGDFPIAPALMLEPGDLVLLLTDGVTEARAPDRTPFGSKRAIDLVRYYRKDTAAQIVDNLYHGVRAFSHYQPQVDDITAVVLKLESL